MAVNSALGSRDADGHVGRTTDGENVGYLDAEGEEGEHPSTLRVNPPARFRLRAAVRLH